MKMTFDSLIDRYNERNDFLIKIWIWIAVISIFGLLVSLNPKILEGNKFPGIDIPIPIEFFLPIYLTVLAGMVLKWVDVFHRSVTLRQEVIEVFLEKEKDFKVEEIEIPKRKMIDGIVSATTSSVWGLVPTFKNNKKSIPIILRFTTYILLKILSFTAHFILPIIALIIPIIKFDYTGISFWYKGLICLIALTIFFSIIKTAYTEIIYGSIVIRKQIL
jgi:hypothetical protein